MHRSSCGYHLLRWKSLEKAWFGVRTTQEMACISVKIWTEEPGGLQSVSRRQLAMTSNLAMHACHGCSEYWMHALFLQPHSTSIRQNALRNIVKRNLFYSGSILKEQSYSPSKSLNKHENLTNAGLQHILMKLSFDYPFKNNS